MWRNQMLIEKPWSPSRSLPTSLTIGADSIAPPGTGRSPTKAGVIQRKERRPMGRLSAISRKRPAELSTPPMSGISP